MKAHKWNRGIESNILRTYGLATESDLHLGLHWYQSAHDEAVTLADTYAIGVWQAVGVIAAISPGLNWGLNVLQAKSLIAAWKDQSPLPTVGVYGRRNVDKAVAILNGTDPLELFSPKSSPKVRSFYLNILSPQSDEAVTIDRHAKALAYNLASTRAGAASQDKTS